MTISQVQRDSMCQKLRMVGLPKSVVLPLVNSLERQVNAEGPENVVTRLKLIKQNAVNHIAGQPLQHLGWIKSRNGIPSGVYRPLWTALSSSNYRNRKKALNALMVYASFMLPQKAVPSVKQQSKFLGSVVDPAPMREISKVQQRAVQDAIKDLKDVVGELRDCEGVDFIPWAMQKLSNRRNPAAIIDANLSVVFHTDLGRLLQAFPSVQKTLGEELVEEVSNLYAPWTNFDQRTSTWQQATSLLPEVEDNIGVVGYTQEPGCKLRAFAAPNLVVQAALEPLKKTLLIALKRCPWDNTHNQQKGIAAVQEWLRKGLTLHAVDLSDATNQFPLSLQLSVLKALGVTEEMRDLLTVVSRGKYRVSWSGEAITWKKGQPLGAGPSFMSFALSHALVALAAERLAGIESGTSFQILGDDIVIADDLVHKHYRELLQVLGCPVSEQKCLSSGLASEFAGKLITKDHVFHGYKYREISDISFMDVIRTLGKQALSKKLLTESQFALASLLAEVPEPWGLGFNPKGIPLEIRYASYLRLLDVLASRKSDPVMVRKMEMLLKYEYTSRMPYYFTDDRVRKYGISHARILYQEYAPGIPIPLQAKIGPALEPLQVAVKPAGDPRETALSSPEVQKAMRSIARLYTREITPTEENNPQIAGDSSITSLYPSP